MVNYKKKYLKYKQKYLMSQMGGAGPDASKNANDELVEIANNVIDIVKKTQEQFSSLLDSPTIENLKSITSQVVEATKAVTEAADKAAADKAAGDVEAAPNTNKAAQDAAQAAAKVAAQAAAKAADDADKAADEAAEAAKVAGNETVIDEKIQDILINVNTVVEESLEAAHNIITVALKLPRTNAPTDSQCNIPAAIKTLRDINEEQQKDNKDYRIITPTNLNELLTNKTGDSSGHKIEKVVIIYEKEEAS